MDLPFITTPLLYPLSATRKTSPHKIFLVPGSEIQNTSMTRIGSSTEHNRSGAPADKPNSASRKSSAGGSRVTKNFHHFNNIEATSYDYNAIPGNMF